MLVQFLPCGQQHEHCLFLGGLIPYVSFVHVDGHGGEGQGGEEDSDGQ